MMSVQVAIRTYAGLNERCHWSVRAKQAKAQRAAAWWALRSRYIRPPDGRLRITMTRMGPTPGLDDDNLAGGLKSIRDGVADWVGMDDADPRLEWVCKQARATRWGVQVDIEKVE